MNCTIYLFNKSGETYTQYPDDYTRDIFDTFCNKEFSLPQIVIHRNNNLMYYSYVRKFNNTNQGISNFCICLVLNDLLFSDMLRLFSFFESVIKIIANGRQLLKKVDNDFISMQCDLYEKQSEIERISDYIRSNVSDIKVESLPTLNYGSSSNENVKFCLKKEDDNRAIIEAVCKNEYIFVCSGEDSVSFSDDTASDLWGTAKIAGKIIIGVVLFLLLPYLVINWGRRTVSNKDLSSLKEINNSTPYTKSVFDKDIEELSYIQTLDETKKKYDYIYKAIGDGNPDSIDYRRHLCDDVYVERFKKLASDVLNKKNKVPEDLDFVKNECALLLTAEKYLNDKCLQIIYKRAYEILSEMNLKE